MKAGPPHAARRTRHLIVPGLAKAGTTFLFEQLAAQDAVFGRAPDKEMNHFTAASSGGPNAEGALLNLAGVHKALGDNVASVNVLKRAADLNSRSPFVLNQLGLAYMDVANYKDAIAQFKKAVGRDDKFAEAHFNLGHAEFKNCNLNEAKKAYRKLRSMQGEDAANYAKQLETITNGAVRS
ncbi:tetratricopeptide repeat protein [Leptolyngbya sp. 15MV]|nr:tetratricopeptide repeat protein [Leptolyngbya sp. 15MV]